MYNRIEVGMTRFGWVGSTVNGPGGPCLFTRVT